MESNLVFHAKTKHIEIDLYFVRDKMVVDEIKIQHIPSQQQAMDILTKALSFKRFFNFKNNPKAVKKTLSLRENVKEIRPRLVTQILERLNTCLTQLQKKDYCQQIQEDKKVV